MIWALKIQSHKYYTQLVEQSFRVTMAILEITSAENCPVQVMLAFGSDETMFPLCILHKDKVWQVPLDLRIEKGSVITFTCKGEGCVYLTGYFESNLLKGPESSLASSAQFSNNKATLVGTENRVQKWIIVDSGEEEEDEEELNLKERKINGSKNQTIKDSIPSVNSNENQSNNDDNCDENIKNVDNDDNYRDNTSSLCYDDNNEMNKSENDNDKIKEENKQEEFQKQEENVKQQKKHELTEKETNEEQKTMKKKKHKEGNVGKRNFICGVQTKKLKSGTGKVAKVGKYITVYYRACAQIGCIKVKIEECLKGNGFTFKVGSRLVIRGVDVGVVGMKVGEKRRLIIPPKMGYGAKGLPPIIPPNSTLIYDIELLQVE